MGRYTQMVSCKVCGQEGHSAAKCKELTPPNPDEMYKGEGCGSDHDHDEEDALETDQRPSPTV